MIPSLPRPAWLRASTVVYAVLFFAFLFLPLARGRGVCVQRRALPGATLARLHAGLVCRQRRLRADRPVCRRPHAGQSVDQRRGGLWVTLLSVLVGTANAFLLERTNFAASKRCRC